MDITKVWNELSLPEGGKIIYLIFDGLGGLPDHETGKSELQTARIKHLDRLAKESSCGLLEMVGAGITPGSGPGHLGLFGYDPLAHRIGRGIFSALGIDFNLQEGDVAARINFATVGSDGKVLDRRAGRLETSLNEELCAKILKGFRLKGAKCFLKTVSEHRAVFILRGTGLKGAIQDTDPQRTGLMPQEPIPVDKESAETAKMVGRFIGHAKEVLRDEAPANMILMRGFDTFRPLPGLYERVKLNGFCIADYPMYRGLSRLIGMDVSPISGSIEKRFRILAEHYHEEYDLFFLHIKHTDSSGEDGNFEEKVRILEESNRYIPELLELDPDVLVVTGDHSTPAAMGMHSWHTVPVLIRAKTARVDDVDRFDEISCIHGALGRRNAKDLMGLALAHAGRLKKYGA